MRRVLAPRRADARDGVRARPTTRPAPALAFGPPADGMAVVDPALPEEAVAFEEDWLLEALRAAGLDLVALHPGLWTGRAGRPELPGRGGRACVTSTSATSASRSSSAATCSTTSSSTRGRSRRWTRCSPELGDCRAREDPADAHPPRPRGRGGRAGAALAGRRGVGARARGAPHARPVAADGLGGADLRRRHGPPVGRHAPRARGPAARALRAASGSARGAWSTRPGHASHHVSYLHEPTGTALVGDVAGLPDRRRPDPPADPAARRRPRGVARVAAHRRGVVARAPRDHPLRDVGRRRRAPRDDARGARPLGRDLASAWTTTAYAAAIEEEMRTKTSDPAVAEAFLRRDAAEDAVGGVGAVLGVEGEGGGLTARVGPTFHRTLR